MKQGQNDCIETEILASTFLINRYIIVFLGIKNLFHLSKYRVISYAILNSFTRLYLPREQFMKTHCLNLCNLKHSRNFLLTTSLLRQHLLSYFRASAMNSWVFEGTQSFINILSGVFQFKKKQMENQFQIFSCLKFAAVIDFISKALYPLHGAILRIDLIKAFVIMTRRI